jgi:bis(5'-nucleosidyl)-tetraphosphatase
LVQGYGNYWGFPKGHAEPNETNIQTALRELEEETQISTISILENTHFRESYVIERKRGPDIFKKVTYFVGEVDEKKAQRLKSEIRQLGWFSIDHAKRLVVPDKKEILDMVYTSIT